MGRSLAVLRPRAHEADRTRRDGRDEQLVVEDGGPAVGVGVDLDVLLPEAFTPVVWSVAELPVRVLGLDELDGLLLPVWAGCFDFFEIWMGVPLDVFFVVHHGTWAVGWAEMDSVIGHTCCCIL